jgi:hypothetical protein
MVEVGLMVGLGTLCLVIVLIWRVWVVEQALHDRVDDIDASLGGVVGMIIEKIDHISSSVPDINLINQNPIGQIIDFLKGNAPPADIITGHPPPKDSTGQFVEVESVQNAQKESEEN